MGERGGGEEGRTFVAQRESSELGIVGETLETDGRGGFDEGDNALAWNPERRARSVRLEEGRGVLKRTFLGELWWLAGLAACRFVEIV